MPGWIDHGPTPPRAVRVVLLTLLFSCCASATALAAPALKVVRYHGYRLAVPQAWPVFDLARDPTVCVRFNRHAVYLGAPGPEQRCPAHAAGRTEAIMLTLAADRARSADGTATPAAAAWMSQTSAPGASAGARVDRVHGLIITATWRADGGLIRRALGLRSLKALSASVGAAGPGHAQPTSRLAARAASGGPATPGGVYTGLGFDACSTPSASHMAAWGSSPFRAVGVYIGGANRACAQPNLTAGWVSQESAAGWHLVPIYVGLQSPSNSCGCAAISRTNASSQGSAAATDAVTQAQSLGIGPGNPIYFDMEAYSRGSGNSPAVLAFLAAWTTQLHAAGYKSAVYSSDDSGISDLVSGYGTGYTEPDEVWVANWNGAKTTSDAKVPPGEWSAHQRLHQYEGGHNETHGGVTINVDGDYLDAATAAAGAAAGTAGEWAALAPPTVAGRTVVGQTLVEGHGSWSGAPTAYVYQWADCNAVGLGCVPIVGATGPSYTLGASDVGRTIRVQETASNASATSVPASSSATPVVLGTTPLYWLYTARGNVNQSLGTAWYGSPVASRYRGSSITGMAATPDGLGYWLITSSGTLYAYGDAPHLRIPRHAHAIKGVVAAPPGGCWLYTASGNVYRAGGAAWYGSPSGSGYRGSSIAGMAATVDGRGYWLITGTGTLYAYGDARHVRLPHNRAVAGIVTAPGGYWLYTPRGNVYPAPGTAWYGSPSSSRYRGASIAGMAPTHDGKGYWLITSGGALYAYGDAARLGASGHPRPIAGIVG